MQGGPAASYATDIDVRGYICRRVTVVQWRQIRQELTIRATATGFGPPVVVPIYCAIPGTDHAILPCAWALKVFGRPMHCTLPLGRELDVELRPGFALDASRSQDEATDAIRSCVNAPTAAVVRGGVVQLPCGGGKTVVACYSIAQIIKRKTMIVVHTKQLAAQWEDRLRTFIPAIRLGFIHGGSDPCPANADVVIAMLQSLAMREVDSAFFNDVGACIFDECHLVNTCTFSRVLRRYNARVMIGLSATPKRKDGMDRVITHHIGGVIYSADREHVDVHVRAIKLPGRVVEIRNDYGKVDQVAMVSRLVDDVARNAVIVGMISRHMRSKILVLSDRRAHLHDLKAMLSERGITDVGVMMGGVAADETRAAESCAIILGTYSIASVGLDVAGLNVLLLATPRSDVTQATGRILRDKSATPKLVVDIVDASAVFATQFARRMTCYTAQRFRVTREKFGEATVSADTCRTPGIRDQLMIE